MKVLVKFWNHYVTFYIAWIFALDTLILLDTARFFVEILYKESYKSAKKNDAFFTQQYLFYSNEIVIALIKRNMLKLFTIKSCVSLNNDIMTKVQKCKFDHLKVDNKWHFGRKRCRNANAIVGPCPFLSKALEPKAMKEIQSYQQNSKTEADDCFRNIALFSKISFLAL